MSDVRHGLQSGSVDRAPFSDSASSVPGKKNVLADQLSRSDRVVSLANSVRGGLRGFRLSPFQLVRCEGEYETATVLVSSFGHDSLEAGCFPAFLGQSDLLRLSPIRSHSAGLVESSAFDRALLGPGGFMLASGRVVC